MGSDRGRNGVPKGWRCSVTTPTWLVLTLSSAAPRIKNTTNSENLLFFKRKNRHKIIKTHLPVVATVSAGHYAPLCVDLVPVKLQLRPQHGQDDEIYEQATQYDTSIERSKGHVATTKQHQSDEKGTHFPFAAKTKHIVTDGFSGQSIANRKCLQLPTSMCPQLNGITSHTNHFRDTQHATVDALDRI